MRWVVFFFTVSVVCAQNVGIGTANPHPTARLEIADTARGFLIPRLTTQQRNAITNPAHALLIFNVDSFCLEAYDTLTAQWYTIACPCYGRNCPTPTCTVTISGPTFACTGDTLTYIASGCSNVSYQWTVPSGWIIVSGQGTNTLKVKPDTSDGQIKVAPCNSCGCGDTAMLSIVSDSCGTFCIAIGGVSDDYGSVLTLTSDGNLAILGLTTSYGQGSYDHYLVKINRQGSLIWTTTIGTSASEYYFSVAFNTLLEYNGILYGGGTTYISGQRSFYWAVNLSDGSLLWSNRTQDHCCYLVGITIPYDTSGIIFSGHSDNLPQGMGNIVLKSDWNGNFVWGKSYTPDNSYFDEMDTIGSLKRYAAGTCNPMGIAVLDSQFNVIWARKIYSSGWIHDLTHYKTQLFATGYTGSSIAVHSSDAYGNFNWTKIISTAGTSGGYGIAYWHPDRIIVVGYTTNGPLGGEDALLFILDKNGNVLNAYAIGGAGNDRFYDLVIHQNQAYLTGATTSFGNGGWDVWIVSIDLTNPTLNCNSGCNVQPFSGYTISSSTTWTNINYSLNAFSGITAVGNTASGGNLQTCP